MNRISAFGNTDIFKILGESWRKFPPTWRQTFYIAFPISLAVFSFTIMNQPLGNHDLKNVPWIVALDQVKLGRWFCAAVYSLTGFAQQPVLTHVLAGAFSVATGIVTAAQLRKDDHVAQMVLLVLLVAISPYVLFHYYYRWMAAIYPLAALFGVSALLVASRLTIPRLAGSSLLILLSIATYQPMVNVIATVFVFHLIFLLIESARINVSFSTKIRDKVIPKVLAIIFGSAFYLISLVPLKLLGVIRNPYQLNLVNPGKMLDRLVLVAKSSFESLVADQVFLPAMTKYLLLLLALTAVAVGTARILRFSNSALMGTVRTVLFLALMACSLFAAKVLFLVSPIGGIHGLKWGYGLAFFYLGCAALIFRYGGVATGNAAAVIMVGILISFCWNDLIYQELLVRGNQHDYAFGNRILGRIEALPDLDPQRSYKYMPIGDYPDFRGNRYFKNRGRYFSNPLGGKTEKSVRVLPPGNQFFNSLAPQGSPHLIFEFLGSKLALERALPASFDNSTSWGPVVKAIEFAEQAEPWPHRSSVGIVDEYIFVYLDKRGLKRMKNYYAARKGN